MTVPSSSVCEALAPMTITAGSTAAALVVGPVGDDPPQATNALSTIVSPTPCPSIRIISAPCGCIASYDDLGCAVSVAVFV